MAGIIGAQQPRFIVGRSKFCHCLYSSRHKDKFQNQLMVKGRVSVLPGDRRWRRWPTPQGKDGRSFGIPWLSGQGWEVLWDTLTFRCWAYITSEQPSHGLGWPLEGLLAWRPWPIKQRGHFMPWLTWQSSTFLPWAPGRRSGMFPWRSATKSIMMTEGQVWKVSSPWLQSAEK